ncbi:conserved exported hypothetical protein [Pseudomonas sp. 8AS]|uniref:hypothetical protein n=1 Tax=Pseudomonas sp. 8AS TaxID=2653163 RepID=UPI0012F2D924|nr:hypothetical protein [Pseudomonas sp. 8AS]VXB18044.1 conserved exported hypothetical protein [Pseudomonas sp. 8AS]
MPTPSPKWLMLVSLSLFSLNSQAMSRLFDGDANVWIANDRLCFGGTEFKSVGLFFNRTLKVDAGQVVVHAIQVTGAGPGSYWAISATDPEHALPITSNTCIAYGERIAHFNPSQAAKPLTDGLYSVMLGGSDLKSGNRATFYQNFCLQHSDSGRRVTAAHYDKSSQQWVCSP